MLVIALQIGWLRDLISSCPSRSIEAFPQTHSRCGVCDLPLEALDQR